jgi:hypothetical protein
MFFMLRPGSDLSTDSKQPRTPPIGPNMLNTKADHVIGSNLLNPASITANKPLMLVKNLENSY